MKTAYFDCSAGASGDMIVGALLDAGVTLEHLKRELAKLRLDGYALRAAVTRKSGLAAVKFDVDLAEAGPDSGHAQDHGHDHSHDHPHEPGHDTAAGSGRAHEHGHAHEHAHEAEHRHDHAHSHDHGHGPGRAGRTVHRNLDDIVRLIGGSGLSPRIRERSLAVFRRLAEAEARVHGCSTAEIHFHEVGAVDAIVDIVGSVIALEALGVEDVRASALHVGSGFVDCAHGRLPVPPPAVTELLKGVPVYATEVRGELVTPTGAALLSTLASSFGPLPEMRLLRTGTGAGFKDLPIPNVLRLMLGETPSRPHEDRIRLIETNIDDMNPQFYDHIMERLFAEGARDVFLTPIVMKKSRPGVVLSVIAGEERTDALVGVMLRETTTLGVRISDMKKRMVLGREVVSVPTRWGDADVKVRSLSESERTVAPEYDHCKRLARATGLPLREVWDAVKRDAEAALARAQTGTKSQGKTGTAPRIKARPAAGSRTRKTRPRA